MYRMIIIDDEKWVIKSLIATLQHPEHFEIAAEFYDGLSAMEYIRKREPDLAFVDVRLPGMTGLDILQRADEEGLKTLFIVISGHAEFAYAQKAMLHNALGYCLKPFSPEELGELMAKAYAILRQDSPEPPRKTPEESEIPVSPVSAIKARSVDLMLSYIKDHYMDDLSIQTLADLCGINPNYAGQIFRQRMNQTLSNYLTSLRIREAKKRLAETTLPVSLVAQSVGFTDYFYFAKVFKKMTGETPTTFRDKALWGELEDAT